MALKATTASGKILHNSYWYGLEQVIETFVFIGTSIAVARYLGPSKLGHFQYINFFVTIVTRTSGNGLASATRKYMSEFLALDRPGTARAVYHLASRFQLIGTLAIALLGLGAVATFVEPGYRLMSSLLILSIIPGVMSWVPAQANQAFEDVSNNTLSAFGYIIANATVIVLTLHFQWDLVGIAAAALVGRTVEVILRTIPLHRRLRLLPLDTLNQEIKGRIRRYCIQAVGIQLLMSVVWDRSELFFLRWFSGYEQIAFYSVSFSFANNLLLIPRTFGNATGISLMLEAGRDASRVASIVWNACRFLLLVAIPVHLGAAAVTSAVIGVAYGPRYAPAIPVLAVAAILSLPRAFQELSEVLMRTADRQNNLLIWLSITGVVNIVLDLALIPHFGAVGAAWANGLAQGFGVVAVWHQARRYYDFAFPVQAAVRFGLAGVVMGGVAYLLGRQVHGVPGLVLGILCAAPTYIVLIKIFRCLEPSDRQRLTPIGDRLPAAMRRAYLATIAFVTPAEA